MFLLHYISTQLAGQSNIDYLAAIGVQRLAVKTKALECANYLHWFLVGFMFGVCVARTNEKRCLLC